MKRSQSMPSDFQKKLRRTDHNDTSTTPDVNLEGKKILSVIDDLDRELRNYMESEEEYYRRCVELPTFLTNELMTPD